MLKFFLCLKQPFSIIFLVLLCGIASHTHKICLHPNITEIYFVFLLIFRKTKNQRAPLHFSKNGVHTTHSIKSFFNKDAEHVRKDSTYCKKVSEIGQMCAFIICFCIDIYFFVSFTIIYKIESWLRPTIIIINQKPGFDRKSVIYLYISTFDGEFRLKSGPHNY